MLSQSKHSDRWEKKETTMANHKLICPKCGDEMNHHADKLVYPLNANAILEAQSVLGGVVEETHGCPGCGAVASRRAG